MKIYSDWDELRAVSEAFVSTGVLPHEVAQNSLAYLNFSGLES
jgi:hypothetical protein